jgi:hypothetical protein
MEKEVPSPQLLVSVRSPEEADAAADGGAQIIDVKEPANGALGMASVEVSWSIANRLQQRSAGVPLSLALGELRDWEHSRADCSSIDNVQQMTTSIASLRWLKCGLAGCVSQPDWKVRWQALRASAGAGVGGRAGWVAVAYADAARADAPDVSAVLEAALEIQASALLIDTYIKDGMRLLDWVSAAHLRELCAECRRGQLPVALAGRVMADDIPTLLGIGPDIVAVRGAVCSGGDRGSRVLPDRVREWRTALDGRESVR